MDWVKLADYGVAVLALLVVLILVDVIRRRYRESTNGDRRRDPLVVGCPNRIEGLHSTLTALVNDSREQTKLNTEQLRILTSNKENIDHLVRAHAPVDGREWWKTTAKAERIQEEIRDGIKDLVRIAKTDGIH